MKEKHYYFGYGLKIESDIEIPELMAVNIDKTRTSSMQVDVHILSGFVPDELEHAAVKEGYYQAKSNQILLQIEDVASFLISNGKEIIIERHSNISDDKVRLYLLGSCFGALLHQRGLLVLHASAIITNQGAVLFVGPSGNGKSTTVAALAKRGYRIIADDVCTLSFDEEHNPVVFPSYPQIKLWEDMLDKLKQTKTPLRRISPELDKYAFQVKDRFFAMPSTLRAVYDLQVRENSILELELLEGSEKFRILLYNTYRAFFLDGLEMRPEHFKLATTIANEISVYRLTRPQIPFLLDEMVDLLEDDFKINEEIN